MPSIDFNGLDITVHGPLRLGVLAALRIDGPLDFTTLKRRFQPFDGNFGVHLHALDEGGYITSATAFVGRRLKTTYRLTHAGAQALVHHLTAQ